MTDCKLPCVLLPSLSQPVRRRGQVHAESRRCRVTKLLPLLLLNLLAPTQADAQSDFHTLANRIDSICSTVDKANVAASARHVETRLRLAIADFTGKRWEDHDRKTRQALYAASQIPAQCLAAIHRDILRLVKEYGAEPMLSFVIDYGARLALIRTRRAEQQFAQLRSSISLSRVSRPDGWTYLRDHTGTRFTGYSFKVARALAYLVFSDMGRNYLLPSARTSGALLPILGMAQQCKASEQPRSSASATAIDKGGVTLGRWDTCKGFLATLKQGLQSEAGAIPGSYDAFMDDLSSIAQSGFGLTESCLGALRDDSFQQMAHRIDEYTQCRTDGNRPSSRSPEGLMSTIGLAYQGSDTYTRLPNGSRWEIKTSEGTQTFEVSETRSDGVFTDYYGAHTTDSNGQTTSEHQEKVTRDYNTGETTTWTYDYTRDSGTGTTTTTETTTIGNDSTSTTTATDANGNTTSTTTTTLSFSDGSTTTFTTSVDATGKVTSTESSTQATDSGDDDDTSVGQPIPDSGLASKCARFLTPDLRPIPAGDPLAPRIIPNPDSPISDATIGACLPKSSGQPQQCASVFLCLEGQVDANCKCGGSRPGGFGVPSKQSACQRIQCSDGAACDPNTGTCSRTGFGLEPPIGVSPSPAPTGPRAGVTILNPILIDMASGAAVRRLESLRLGLGRSVPGRPW